MKKKELTWQTILSTIISVLKITKFSNMLKAVSTNPSLSILSVVFASFLVSCMFEWGITPKDGNDSSNPDSALTDSATSDAVPDGASFDAGPMDAAWDGSLLSDPIPCVIGQDECPNGWTCYRNSYSEAGPGACSQACEETTDCVQPVTGTAVSTCGSEGYCRFICSNGETCPDGMSCEAIQLGSITIYRCQF